MVRPKGDDFGDEGKGDASDWLDRPIGGEDSDDSSEIDGSVPSGASVDGWSRGLPGALPGRIRDVLRDGADADLLLGHTDVENEIAQWLQALDLQVIGGCRADERLKPLLKLNALGGAAEDQFMAQLIQHFEASEVAVLARCLCLPLVSVRVGKIIRQGNMLCPTASRGFLSLSLLPSCHMRISFTGDDGCIERLALVSNDFESSSVIIEDISADTTGRSYLLKLSDSRNLFFWCSEKLKVDGMELILKMKDLLRRKPSLSDLTGISELRLDSFATHLRVYLLASSNTPTVASAISSSGSLMGASCLHASEAEHGCPSKSSRIRISAGNAAKMHPVYQSSLSPRSNTFKDGTFRSSSLRNGVRERVRRRGDPSINIQPTSVTASSHDPSTSQNDGDNVESHGSHGLVLPILSSLPSPLFSLNPTFTISSSLFSNQSSFLSPYYCWCPPSPSSLQYNTTSHLPGTSQFLPLPPLSTLLPAAAQPESLVTSKFPLNVELQTLKLPSFLPEPLVHLSSPIFPLCPLPSSQQIPTFTPFMSDPIVHIPVIDVCSSGQGYLVSAGPAISAAIPPLPISHVSHPLIPPSESPVEKNARETLRMLMASTPTLATPKLFNVLPEVLSSMELCGNARETLRMLMVSTPTLATPKLFNVLPEVLSSMELCGNGSSITGRECLFGMSSLELSSAGDVSHDEFTDETEERIWAKQDNHGVTSYKADEI